MNVLPWREFDLAYCDAAVQHISDYAALILSYKIVVTYVYRLIKQKSFISNHSPIIKKKKKNYIFYMFFYVNTLQLIIVATVMYLFTKFIGHKQIVTSSVSLNKVSLIQSFPSPKLVA